MIAVKVSVLLITYNQEKYIEQAIKSILMQKTNFIWELLIGDDASTDRTADIVKQYSNIETNNFTVKTIIRIENVGASRNLFDLIRKANGEYITVLEGDDYWLGENRLQTLANFLNKHSEYSTVSHKRERRNIHNELLGFDPSEKYVGNKITLKEYENGHAYSAMGCMFRNIYKNTSDNYESMYTVARNACDLIMCYDMLMHGNVFVLNEVFGVYRVSSSEENYCSRTKAIDIIKDYIALCQALVCFYGKRKKLLNRISFLQLDGIHYYNKHKMKEERKIFTSHISTNEKARMIIRFPYYAIKKVQMKLKIK
ncbi:MAG: hypothetical protein A2Y17_07370 [Clostridiales bacterium GWF2_38_85]|nr:MAG: hypothetical protein A2Y17_07370 [Clostridiales bacterium GWF2_38_85]HBL84308.1 hypothetical protein [Clostridiales bacterium]